MVRISGRRVFPIINSRILLSARRVLTLGSAISTSFQTIFFALFEEGFAADAEGCGGAADLVMRGFERGGDDFALHFLQGTEAGDRAGGARRSGAHSFRKIFGLE